MKKVLLHCHSNRPRVKGIHLSKGYAGDARFYTHLKLLVLHEGGGVNPHHDAYTRLVPRLAMVSLFTPPMGLNTCFLEYFGTIKLKSHRVSWSTSGNIAYP